MSASGLGAGFEPPRPGTARRWAWLVVLGVGIGLFELVRLLYQGTGNPNLFPSLLLLAAAVMPASFGAFLYGRRLQYQLGPATLLCVALLGGVVGVLASGLLEYDTLHRLGVLPSVAVAVIEEMAKLIVPGGFLLWSRRPRRLADGLILGVACGAGFAVLETLGYSSVEILRSHENLNAVVGLLLQRGLFSPATHMAWTGMTAAALWYAVGRRGKRPSIAVLVGAFAFVVGLHALWDSVTDLLGYIGIAALSLTSIGVVVHVAAARPLAKFDSPGTTTPVGEEAAEVVRVLRWPRPTR